MCVCVVKCWCVPSTQRHAAGTPLVLFLVVAHRVPWSRCPIALAVVAEKYEFSAAQGSSLTGCEVVPKQETEGARGRGGHWCCARLGVYFKNRIVVWGQLNGVRHISLTYLLSLLLSFGPGRLAWFVICCLSFFFFFRWGSPAHAVLPRYGPGVAFNDLAVTHYTSIRLSRCVLVRLLLIAYHITPPPRPPRSRPHSPCPSCCLILRTHHFPPLDHDSPVPSTSHSRVCPSDSPLPLVQTPAVGCATSTMPSARDPTAASDGCVPATIREVEVAGTPDDDDAHSHAPSSSADCVPPALPVTVAIATDASSTNSYLAQEDVPISEARRVRFGGHTISDVNAPRRPTPILAPPPTQTRSRGPTVTVRAPPSHSTINSSSINAASLQAPTSPGGLPSSSLRRRNHPGPLGLADRIPEYRSSPLSTPAGAQ